tara:strand:+ start:5907 stop:6422 length:516 start_codon:yes stop_codon:yes gene_type:complete
MPNIDIKFNIEEEKWLEYDNNIVKNITIFLKEISKKIEINLLKGSVDIEISILLTNNNQIRKLNQNYRQKHKATNILAFPLYDINLRNNQNISEYLFDNNLMLGDLVLSLEYIKNESVEQDKNFYHHLKHLLLHGLLHLIGYDHIDNNDRKTMEELEINILKEFNIKDPYL